MLMLHTVTVHCLTEFIYISYIFNKYYSMYT